MTRLPLARNIQRHQGGHSSAHLGAQLL